MPLARVEVAVHPAELLTGLSHAGSAPGDAVPPAGQAHVYRVTASQQGQVFGGYTIVLLA